MDLEYLSSVRSLRAEHPELAEQLAAFDSLEGLLAWIRGRGGSLGEVEVVAQDEFCHDFVVPFDDRFLAFAST